MISRAVGTVLNSNKDNGFSPSSSPPVSHGMERQFEPKKPLVFSVG